MCFALHPAVVHLFRGHFVRDAVFFETFSAWKPYFHLDLNKPRNIDIKKLHEKGKTIIFSLLRSSAYPVNNMGKIIDKESIPWLMANRSLGNWKVPAYVFVVTFFVLYVRSMVNPVRKTAYGMIPVFISDSSYIYNDWYGRAPKAISCPAVEVRPRCQDSPPPLGNCWIRPCNGLYFLHCIECCSPPCGYEDGTVMSRICDC